MNNSLILRSFQNPSFSAQPEFSLVVPCYCEEPFLRRNVLRLVDLLSVGRFQFEFVFVEDKSPDNTLRELLTLADELRQRGVSHTVIGHEVNRGRGAAVKSGIRAAKGKVAGFIDIDLENSPDAIFPMYALVESRDLDLVVGSRVQFGPDLRPIRRITHLVYKWLVHCLVDLPVSDSETGLKIFRRDAIAGILDLTENDHWFWDTEVVLVAHACGLKVGEHPVLFYRDDTKQSTVRIVRDSWLYVRALLEYRRWPLRKRVRLAETPRPVAVPQPAAVSAAERIPKA